MFQNKKDKNDGSPEQEAKKDDHKDLEPERDPIKPQDETKKKDG
ncbi:hypothetical protein [Bacillus sp. REN3]|nr:hypothetical protein [Bacillus sp. REN3]